MNPKKPFVRNCPQISAISEKQKQAVRAILLHRTLTDAATAAGVTSRTLRRWKEEEAFVDALRDAQHEATDAALVQLESGLCEAVESLRELLGNEDPHVQARAAGMLLRHGLDTVSDRTGRSLGEDRGKISIVVKAPRIPQ